MKKVKKYNTYTGCLNIDGITVMGVILHKKISRKHGVNLFYFTLCFRESRLWIFFEYVYICKKHSSVCSTVTITFNNFCINKVNPKNYCSYIQRFKVDFFKNKGLNEKILFHIFDLFSHVESTNNKTVSHFLDIDLYLLFTTFFFKEVYLYIQLHN